MVKNFDPFPCEACWHSDGFFDPLKFTGKTKALAILLGLVWLLNAWAMPHGCRVDRNDLWVEDKDCIPCKCHMPYDITLYHVINHQSLLSYYLNQTTHTCIHAPGSKELTLTHCYIRSVSALALDGLH